MLRTIKLVDNLASPDPTYDHVLSTILTSIHVNVSIVVSCISFLKPVLYGLQSGILAGDVRSLAPLGSSAYIFSGSRKQTTDVELKDSRLTLGKSSHSAGESQDRIIRETREVYVEFANSHSVESRDRSG